MNKIMNRPYLHILIVLLCFLPFAGQGGEQLSLKEFIQLAIANNLQQQSYRINEESARVSSRQAKMNLLPSVSASSGGGVSYGRSVDSDYNIVNTSYFSSSFDLGASVTLFQGFILQNKMGYARYQLDVQKWTRINNSDDLAFDVMEAYYNLIYYDGLAQIAGEQLELSDFNLRKTEKQIETGLKARTDLAEMQAAREKEKLNQMQAQNKVEECRLKLARYLNLPAGKLPDVPTDSGDSLVTLSFQPDADSIYAAHVQQSAYVKIAEANLQAATKQLAIARGSYSPSLSLGASVGSSYSELTTDDSDKTIPFRTQVDNNLGEYVGASLSIPIFSKNQVRSTVQQAKLDKEQAQTELEDYRQTVYYELMNNSRELQSLYQEYLQTGKQYEAEELAFRVAQRKYDEGILNVIDLLTVKNRLAEVKASLLSARLQFSVKEKVIEFYKGNRFWE